jgi:hypothetical protein
MDEEDVGGADAGEAAGGAEEDFETLFPQLTVIELPVEEDFQTEVMATLKDIDARLLVAEQYRQASVLAGTELRLGIDGGNTTGIRIDNEKKASSEESTYIRFPPQMVTHRIRSVLDSPSAKWDSVNLRTESRRLFVDQVGRFIPGVSQEDPFPDGQLPTDNRCRVPLADMGRAWKNYNVLRGKCNGSAGAAEKRRLFLQFLYERNNTPLPLKLSREFPRFIPHPSS